MRRLLASRVRYTARSVVAWPIVFLTDVAFGDYLLPWAEAYCGPQGASGDVAVVTAGCSLVPKAAGSYLGATVYVPNAWWFWRLSLLPALPVSATFSVAYHLWTTSKESGSAEAAPPPQGGSVGDGEDGLKRPFDVVTWQEDSSEFPHVAKPRPSLVGNAAFQPSSSAPKSYAKRLLEAAPNPVQIAVLAAWPQGPA